MTSQNPFAIIEELKEEVEKELAENIKWMQQQRIKELNGQLAECESELSWSKDQQTNDHLRGRIYAIECELEAIQDGN